MTGRARPCRGEVWQVDLRPAEGHEQDGFRPFLILSVDELNHSPAGLVTGLPITTAQKALPARITLRPPAGGLPEESYILCDQIRTISTERLIRRYGRLEDKYITQALNHVRYFLGI